MYKCRIIAQKDKSSVNFLSRSNKFYQRGAIVGNDYEPVLFLLGKFNVKKGVCNLENIIESMYFRDYQ